MARYSAYVPFFNNAATMRAAVASLLAQTDPPAEVVAVDDGSTDGSAGRLAGLPVRIVAQAGNLGRGATRARAMLETREELVLCCDATNLLQPGHAARCLAWLSDERVAAVFGRISDPHPHGAANRWRERHLYKSHRQVAVARRASLATCGAMVRRRDVMRAGGFNPALRHGEDGDLGQRLLAAGGDVIFDPELSVRCHTHNSLAQVLERYWRWNTNQAARMNLGDYARNISYSVRVMAAADLRARDFAAVPISLLCPHYQYFCNLRNRRDG